MCRNPPLLCSDNPYPRTRAIVIPPYTTPGFRERLSAEEQRLVQHIWDASGRELNPRYLRPAWEFKDNTRE